MGKIQRAFLISFVITAWSGISAGFLFGVYPHELGHYAFAYMGNSSSIEKIEFYQGQFLREILDRNMSNTFTARARVSYRGNVHEIFRGPWFYLVGLGGLIFSLATLTVLIGVLEWIKPSENNGTKAFLFLFINAFFLGVAADAYQGWWEDGLKIMHHSEITKNFDIEVIAVTSTLIMTTALFFSWRYFNKFLRFYPDRFPKELSLSLIIREIQPEILWDSLFLRGEDTYDLPDRKIRFQRTKDIGPKYFVPYIQIPEYVMKEFSDNEKASVFYHEISHSRPLGILYFLILVYLLATNVLVLLAKIPFIPVSILNKIHSNLDIRGWNFELFIILVLSMIILKWTDEIYADLYSVMKTKNTQLMLALEKVRKKNGLMKLVGKITHPPKSWRFWIIVEFFKVVDKHRN